MGFSFHATGCAKEFWNESHPINGCAPASTTKEKPARVTWGGLTD
jgi:hypothetical protein